MPILPLDHPEPFAATLGVMLYPGTNNDDPRKARAFAARWLAVPLQRFDAAGHKLSYEAVLQIAMDGGHALDDLSERWWSGTATGELFKAVWALVNSKAELASWNNAVRIAKLTAPREQSTSRSALWKARSLHHSVAHLWAACSIREYEFKTDLNVGYDGWDDFQSFLTEAEILRDFGQTWLPERVKSKPLLPLDVWRVSENWKPSERQPDWPETGQLPVLTLPEDLVASLKSAGRPPRHP